MRTINLYRFNELVETAAIKQARKETEQLLHENFDNNECTRWLKDYAETKWGIALHPYWSLSHSQGDGVAWYGDLDVSKISDQVAREMWEKIGCPSVTLIKSNQHYDHHNSMRVEIDTDDDGPLAAQIQLFVRTASLDVARKGYDYIDSRTEANDEECDRYEYLADGRIYGPRMED